MTHRSAATRSSLSSKARRTGSRRAHHARPCRASTATASRTCLTTRRSGSTRASSQIFDRIYIDGLMSGVTLSALRDMKRDGKKIVGVVLYDYQMAQVADRAGVEIVSVGDSVGVNIWGLKSEADVTLDQMVLVCRAVRRGVTRALVSCDVPLASLQGGLDAAVRAAVRLVEEGGTAMVKVDAAASSTDAIRAIVDAGIPVWAQFGTDPAAAITDRLVREAVKIG